VKICSLYSQVGTAWSGQTAGTSGTASTAGIVAGITCGNKSFLAGLFRVQWNF
jgi:hypothetical protein